MNTTPRLLNRIVILIAGIAALALGAAAIAVATAPDLAGSWTDGARAARTALGRFAGTTAFGPDGGHSWLWFAAIGLCAVGIVLSILLILRQGRGRTRTLLRRPAAAAQQEDPASPRGAVVIEARVAEQAIVAALVQHPELLSVQASTHLIRGTRGLRITAASRRGISPTRTVELIERTVRAWDAALGEEVPVLIELVAGIRTRTGRPSRAA